MKKYICKEKVGDRIRIKIIIKEGKERVGVAHNEKEKKMYMALPQERIRDKNQQEFKFMEYEEKPTTGLIHKKSYSKYLYNTTH